MFLVNWTIVIEVSLLVLFFVGSIVITSIFLGRSVISSYKEVYKYQSKLDIELRKILNLISKVMKDELIESTSNLTIKDLPFSEKQKLVLHVGELLKKIDLDTPENQYLAETYDNLHEVRRTRDGLALIYNQKISMFPFRFFSKLFKLYKWNIYTDTL